uniref:BSD domain-containing protein n=1 Tax=Globodera pallida TaxID=36090 RepID=A0A183C017_GLOPA
MALCQKFGRLLIGADARFSACTDVTNISTSLNQSPAPTQIPARLPSSYKTLNAFSLFKKDQLTGQTRDTQFTEALFDWNIDDDREVDDKEAIQQMLLDDSTHLVEKRERSSDDRDVDEEAIQRIAAQQPGLLLKVECVKYRKAGPGKSPLGSLCIHDDRIQWSSELEKDDQLSVPFSKVKGQRISPPNKPKVQLQLCMFNEDVATFVFMNPAHSQEQLFAERDLVKEMLQQALVRHRQLVNQMAQQSAKGGSDREREAKQHILQQNTHLWDMYKHLVASKLITPQDFWSFHYKTDDKDTNGNDANGEQQRVGVSAGFLSSIVQSEGINGIRLNLTTETIQAIFRTYPAVERKHLELVPHELSEQEFWSRFFQSHYFHRAAVEFNGGKQVGECLKRIGWLQQL